MVRSLLRIDPFDPDTELRSLLIALLRRRKGFGIDLFGVLQIDEMENGHVRVLDQRDSEGSILDGTEYIFKDVKEGVDFFLAIRKERCIGFDFDRHAAREEAAREAEEHRQAKARYKLIDDTFNDDDEDED